MLHPLPVLRAFGGEFSELDGQSDSEEETRAVLQVKVEMGFMGVTRITAQGDNLPSVNFTPGFDLYAALLQVGEETVFSRGMAYDNKVAPEVAGPPINPPRPWSGIIGEAVSNLDHDAVSRSKHGPAEGVIIIKLFPVSRMRAPALVRNEEIIGIALVNDIPRMRSLFVHTAPGNGPPALEGQG
jgi:hypothetical protein